MTPARAIAEMIARSDIAQVGATHVLVVDLTTELLEFLVAFDAAREDLEDSDTENMEVFDI